MKLAEKSIERHQFVIILVFLALLFGLVSYFTMPRAEDPDITVPFYLIAAIYPGTSPEDMEELIANPLEEELNELEDLETINTTIYEGLAILSVEGYFGVNVEDLYDKVTTAVNQVRPDLPADLFSLEVKKFSPLDVVVMQLAIVSEKASYARLLDTGEDLQDALQGISGVRDVDVVAYPEQEIRVALDFEKMALQNIPLSQVIGILKGNNSNIPGGVIKAGNKAFSIKTSGEYESLRQIGNTVISAADGKIVQLKDIATVGFDYQDDRWIARYNGKKCLFVTVTQKKSVNILSLSQRLESAVADFRERLPADIQLETAFLQAPAVESRLNNFMINLLQGILLVGIIILMFLGLRPSLIVMTVIPVSILIGIGALDLSGFTIQQISIAALVLALGLLVDNGIVVVENILRLRKTGLDIKSAAIRGTSEVGPAIISSTITTLLAFFPLTRVGGPTGAFIRSLPMTVIFTLIASLILALTLTPILANRLMGPYTAGKSWLMSKINRFIEGRFTRTLRFALRRPLVIFAIAGAGFGLSILVFPIVGVSFFPTADKPLLLIDISTPEGSNIDHTDRAVRFVTGILDTLPDVASYSSNTGHGNPRVYYNRNPVNYQQTEGQVMVNLKSWEGEQFYTLIGKLRRHFADYPEARITVAELRNGPPFAAPIEIKIVGKELSVLRRIAGDIEKIIGDTPGTLDVENPVAISKTDLRVQINRDKAGMAGLMLQDIDLAVRTAMTGFEVDQVYFSDGKEYPIILRLPVQDQLGIEDFNKIYVTSQAGGQIPIRQVANIQFEKSIPRIDHYQLQRTATVTAGVFDGDKTAGITREIIEKLDEYPFPAGYSYYVAGEFETQQESFGDLGSSVLFALIGIFAVLVLQFRSIRQPLIVFSAIPFAFMGSIFALLITGWSFSFLAFVGFTSLVGIVINNSIILVDFANQLLRNGEDRLTAIEKAAKTRFTPIVLTTLTTILGLLPLTLSNTSLWSPLGWTIIGGMISSTLLVLVIVPILYNWFTAENRGVS